MNKPMMLALAAAAGWAVPALAADPLAPRPNGPMPAPPSLHLIDNATVRIAPGAEPKVMDVLIENGRIARVAETIEPGAARVWDAEGRHLYAGFIDAYVPVSAPAGDTAGPGTHWSPLVGPHRDALNGAGLPSRDAEALRKLGFTAAGIAPDAGVFRGWGAVVSTAEPFADKALGKPPVYRARAAQHLGFEKAGWRTGDYPTSHMGVVALMRQTLVDAAFRADAGERSGGHADASVLDAIDPGSLMVYDTAFELEALLADKVASEFGHERVAIVGSGTEFKRLDALAAARRPIIAPLVLPAAPDVWTVGAADATSLEDLKSWEQAPANARWLAEKGLQVSLTSSKLPRNQKFHDNLSKNIDAGLTPEQALAMLTTNPAELLGVSDTMGTVEKGKVANFVITSAPLFHGSDAKGDDKAKILSVWVDGRHHKIADAENTRFDGTWTLTVVGTPFTMSIEVDGTSIKAIEGDDEGKARKVSIKDNHISMVIDSDEEPVGAYLLSGVLGPDGVIRGTGVAPDQSVYEWTGTKAEPEPEPEAAADAGADDAEEAAEEADENAEDKKNEPKESAAEDLPQMPVGAPFGAYTVESYPEQKNYLLVNATVWTQSDKGTLENGWVLVRDGKIAQIGTGGYPRIAAEVIDCEGKHITPGLIDAHSHTGLFRLGVNESGQAVTSEVRIADSIDPGHINWYRQLAGGVTAANLLHGSANPIGGQSQTVKNRWGAPRAEDMLFENARPGIKFALGENVKQSNWGDRNTTRYPQTRLGVETIIRDRFTKAREYGIARGMLKADPDQPSRSGAFLSTEPVSGTGRAAADPDSLPRDLELEILAEILSGDRLVHCHSYRQDEILMLCRVAEDFGFKIGTFQHGLETYKVAEVVKEHAIGASIFSDWWAFKVEVQDAIAAAGPINFEAGLLTSYNSDSDELARRMNAEAGKAYKYAKDAGIDMTREQALNFVTRNPAIQLGIIDRVGTIEVGKDADLVVWSGDPLSSMTRAERTFVDGRQLFSIEQDAALREGMRAERTRLIGKIMAEGKPKPKAPKEDSESDVPDRDDVPTRRSLLARTYERAMQEHVEHGTRPGDCGCNLLPSQFGFFND
jgi:imidazolonepropionase-like amidohydrolase